MIQFTPFQCQLYLVHTDRQTHARAHARMHARTHARTHTHTHTYTRTHTHTLALIFAFSWLRPPWTVVEWRVIFILFLVLFWGFFRSFFFFFFSSSLLQIHSGLGVLFLFSATLLCRYYTKQFIIYVYDLISIFTLYIYI